MSNSNFKVIYSLWVHVALQSLGFEYITEMKNPNNQKLNCWVYEETQEFMEAFNSIVNGGKVYDEQ